jgi:hypothetical protein
MASRFGHRREPNADKAGTGRPLTSSLLFLAALGGVMVLAGAGLGAWYATQGSGGKSGASSQQSSTQASPPILSHRAYALLFLNATLKKTRISVLRQWPNPPYQHYTAGKQDCFEWWDKPIALYNLCFEHGVLTTKAIE